MQTGTSIIAGVAYHAHCEFDRHLSFVNFIAPQFDSVPPSAGSLTNAIEEYTSSVSRDLQKPVTQSTARRLHVSRDLNKIATTLLDSSLTSALRSELLYEEALETTLSSGLRLLGELGLSPRRPNLFIVDQVPAPYDKADYKAIATDAADWEHHGVVPGIYVVRRHLRPFYTRSLVLHELIHSVVAQPDPYKFGRGLEEGLAELVGSMYLTSKILGPDLATQIFAYTRLRYGFDQFWEIYLDYTRQAAYLYTRFGLDGIVALLKAGRQSIKEVELRLSQGLLSQVSLPSGNWDVDLTSIVDFTTMTFCRNLVISPLAKYLIPFIRAGARTREILAAAHVELDEGLKAIEELQNRVVLVILSPDRTEVTFSDTPLLASTHFVRYQIV